MNQSESAKNLTALMERIQATNHDGVPLSLSSTEMATVSQCLNKFMAEISTMEIQDPDLKREIEVIKFFLKMYNPNPP